ncbi:MAG: O-antigen/teichoic acid export membrane protein [Psychroserpens sp.]|jgi:O-antigen/teichoic acid export membrane protein
MSTVSKNILWSTGTSILQLYTGSAVFLVLAKILTVSDFGILSFGFSLSALVVIAADFGFSQMIIKDFPKHKLKFNSYHANSILSKLILSIIAGSIFLLYLLFFFNGKWLMVGIIYIVFAILYSFVIFYQTLLKLKNKFHKYTESTVIYAVFVTIIILYYYLSQPGLLVLVFLMLIARACQLIWTLYISREFITSVKFSKKITVTLLKNSWSYGLQTILGIFYFMIDTQLISLFLGADEVALYQSVFRIILILLLFSDVVTNTFVPYLSFKLFNGKATSKLITKIFFYLLLMGTSMFLLFTTFKNEIITTLYTSEYKSATILVLPFSIVVVLRTVSAVLGNVLTISNKQVHKVIAGGVSLLVSLGLNLIFIPLYGIESAAWISVLVHFILFVIYQYQVKKLDSSISIANFDNIASVILTILLFLFIQLSSLPFMYLVLVSVCVWLLFLLFILKRNNNFKFLLEILKDKGTE